MKEMISKNIGEESISHLPSPENREELLSILIEDMITLEHLYHQKSSGVDIKTVLNRGVTFIEGKFINKIASSKLNQVLLINTGVVGSTKEAVSTFAKFREEIVDADQKIKEIGQITRDIRSEICENNFWNNEKFQNLIKRNQEILSEFGVSHPENQKAVSKIIIPQIEICQKFSACCKMTGAGLGGNCIAFPSQNTNFPFLVDALNEAGFDIMKVDICDSAIPDYQVN